VNDTRVTLRSFGIALAVVVALVVAFWIQYPPRYLTNDDVAIRLGIEGTAVPGQAPTGFVLMTHSILGWTLVWAHHLLPAAPLWDLTVAATLVCALAVLFALAWTALGTRWIPRLTAVSAMLVVALPLIAPVQFTIGATLAGSASVLLAVTELASPRPRRVVIVMSVILLVAGLLVRPMGGAAGALITGSVLVPWFVWRTRADRARTAYLAATLIAVLALSGGLNYVDGLIYRTDQAWDAYHQYNWMAAQLVEWGGDMPADDIASIRAAAGWSSNDWSMLQRWLAVDPALHGFKQVSHAYAARTAAMPWNEWLSWTARQAADGSGNTLRNLAIDSVTPLIAITAIAALYARWRHWAALALGAFLFCIVCIGIEARFKDLPFRVVAPLQAGMTAAALIISGALHRKPPVAAAIVGLALVVTLFTHQTRAILEAAERDHRHTAQVEQEVHELLRLSPSLIVMQADAFPAEHWWRPFVQPPVALQAISLATINPFLQEFLTKTGRQPVFRAICEDPSILVISEEDRLNLITMYFREHFNRKIAWTKVYSGSFRAWRCVG
jgi:hypothetical protein